MLRIKIRCPVCGKKLSTDPDKAGRMAQCPHCGDSIRIIPPRDMPAGSDERVREDILRTIACEPSGAGPARSASPHGRTPTGGRAAEPEEPSPELLWKILFCAVTPLVLILGAFGGYELRPLQREARKLARLQEQVAEARGELEDARTRLADVESQALELLAAAREQAQALQPVAGREGPSQADTSALARAYASKVAILNYEVGKSDFHTRALKGEIQNQSSFILYEVELTVTFLSEDGAAVLGAPLRIYPVSASQDAMGLTPPLQPGGTTSFYTGMEDAPPGWTDDLRVEVTRVRLNR